MISDSWLQAYWIDQFGLFNYYWNMVTEVVVTLLVLGYIWTFLLKLCHVYQLNRFTEGSIKWTTLIVSSFVHVISTTAVLDEFKKEINDPDSTTRLKREINTNLSADQNSTFPQERKSAMNILELEESCL